ncbi:hypothetical protein [Streptomyces sp. NPDC005907]|uniref:hypothetical protein n=1 Tax=Streptomyces sp. NPDC005907 TaxID=3154571 RepID=UPI00340BF2AC
MRSDRRRTRTPGNTPVIIQTTATGLAYDTGAVSSDTRSKAGSRPVGVSSAGTKTAIPGTGNRNCRTGENDSRLRYM